MTSAESVPGRMPEANLSADDEGAGTNEAEHELPARQWADYQAWPPVVYRLLWYLHFRWLSREIAQAAPDEAKTRRPHAVKNGMIVNSRISEQWQSTSRSLSAWGEVRVAALLAYGAHHAPDNIVDPEWLETSSEEAKEGKKTQTAIDLVRDACSGSIDPESYLELAREKDDPEYSLATVAAEQNIQFDSSSLDGWIRETFSSQWFDKGESPSSTAIHARARALVDAFGYDFTNGTWTPKALVYFPRRSYVLPIGTEEPEYQRKRFDASDAWTTDLINTLRGNEIRLLLDAATSREVRSAGSGPDDGLPTLGTGEYWAHRLLEIRRAQRLEDVPAQIQGAGSKSHSGASPVGDWKRRIEGERVKQKQYKYSVNLFAVAAGLVPAQTTAGPLGAAAALLRWYANGASTADEAAVWAPFMALNDEMRANAHYSFVVLLAQAKYAHIATLRESTSEGYTR